MKGQTVIVERVTPYVELLDPPDNTQSIVISLSGVAALTLIILFLIRKLSKCTYSDLP